MTFQADRSLFSRFAASQLRQNRRLGKEHDVNIT
jgi:hypothetical protein